MANPGVGNKFVSVNLNKSFGQQQQHHHHSSTYSSRTGRAANGHHHGGGGGGMVVLSRPRSSQKAGPKLSVPPPMNLPSLRKEHEKFDSSGAGSGPTAGGVPGIGMRPSSSGMRWSKPAGLQEKEDLVVPMKGVHDHDVHGGAADGFSSKGVGSSLRSIVTGAAYAAVEKPPVLRGEDFPSLRASLPAASGPAQKLKDSSTHRQKQVASELVTAASEPREGSNLGSQIDTRPQQLSSRYGYSNGHENEGQNNNLGSSRMREQNRKENDYFAGPLPLVRVNPRSDWADDERDTGHGLMDRIKDNGFVRREAYWEDDFDVPKASFLPLKPSHSSFDRWALRDSATGNFSSGEVPKAEFHGRDVRTPSRDGREGNSWRAPSPLSKDNVIMQEAGTDRNGFAGRPSATGVEMKKDNRFAPSLNRDGPQNDVGRNGLGGKLPWNNTRDRYGSNHVPHNNLTSKASIGVKVPSFAETATKFTKEKRLISKSENSYSEDPFLKDFGDGWDPLSRNILGVVKRKKDVVKDAAFHDPVRESFEAELERVQKMQEQERQRIIEEQEKALELACREEEERARLAREQEEMHRRLEEEAREAAWRAEEERLEALRKAEEQRVAREEEKHRIFMEEERRKQAAKLKLLELEEKIAKRQADATKDGSKSSLVDDKVSDLLKEKDTIMPRETESFVTDVGDWEDSERVVERILTPASSDSYSLNKPFDMSSRPNVSRDNSSSLTEKGKPTNTWRRDPFENGSSSTISMTEQDATLYGPRRDASFGGKSSSRKEFYGGTGFGMSRTYSKGGASDIQMEAYPQMRGHRWNLADGDPFSRNSDVDPEFAENPADKFGDGPWGQGHSHGNPYSLYPEQYYQQPEAEGPYSFGRSRHSMRQPRVPPPPSLASMHSNKSIHKGENKRPEPSSFLDGMQYHSAGRREPTIPVDYDSNRPGNVEMESVEALVEQKPDQEAAPRCDSQSSLSVSNPPDSPVHLSHDDLDESGDYPVKSADRDFLITGKAGQANIMIVPSSVSSSIDDGEWALENNAGLQEQEEYDDDEEGYREDEVREGEDENIHLSQEFEDMRLEDKASASMMDSLVLGFDEDVGVLISNNELEISSQKEVSTYPAQAVGAEENEPFEKDGRTHIHADGSPQATVDRQETEAGMQAAITKPNDNRDDNSKSHILSVHLAAPSGTTSLAPQSSGYTLMPSAPAFATQAELPVKLQFGLFSGPSLIPTPVPAIQIGSIQMPLHLHPQSLGPVHPSQPPLFQFGQLRYTSPISPGVVPLASQSMSFLHPSVPANFSLNKNPGGPVSMQSGEDAPQNFEKINSRSISMGAQQGLVPRPSDASQTSVPKEANSLSAREKREHFVMIQQGHREHPAGQSNNMSNFRVQEQQDRKEVAKSYRSLSNSKEKEDQAQIGVAPQCSGRQRKDFPGSKGHGSMTNSRGKHYVFKVKNASTKPAFPDSEASQLDGAGFQRKQRRMVKRTEFRVRDNGEKGQSASFGSADQLGMGDRSNMNGRYAVVPPMNGSRKTILTNKVSKHPSESMSAQELGSGSGAQMGSQKESSVKSQMVQQSRSLEGSSKRETREEDVDSSLQSGVVRVFEQPGIEAPSDEDDFIEVRSKRQMLNDKREQREKEIKAKSRVSKVSRRPRSTSNAGVSVSSKLTASRAEGTKSSTQTDFAGIEGLELADFEVSSCFNPTGSSQQLAPIGTPPAKSEASADLRSFKTTPFPYASGTGQNFMPGPSLAFKDKNADDAQTSLDSWGSPGINQPVMALTQSQLDEAMKPANFESHISVGDHTIAVSEHIISSSSILPKDTQFPSAASPINSLLAGEKIQFGAVTSPTVLPPSSHLDSHGIRPLGPCQPDIQIPHKIPTTEKSCCLFFEKEKNSDESCAHLEDCEAEAEAEAAASAVAVAAIGNDEIIGNGLGNCSLSVSDTKSYGAVNADGIAAGVTGGQQSANQLRTEEPLSVSLPADLSVETPPISLWPPRTLSQATSSQMLSHFPAGPPSHFPFYDMNVNAMMGSPIFAFGPNEESSAAPQSHAQKTGGPSSGPHPTWHHSNVDSFYGGPTGFTGPFISPGGIPGVQAPPHMVVYNHFAPVGGQFGQVGLSFMGTTFIPSGKQPDWKHNPAGGEGDVNNMNIVSAQRNAISMTSPIQHLAPGSPLLPMASHLPMFDVSPFQSSSELPVHARWSPLPTSTFQSVPMSMPMQQQTEGLLPHFPPQYPNNNNAPPPVEQSVATSRPVDSSRDFHVAAATDPTATQLPDELGLVEEPSGPSSSKQVGAAAKSSADSGIIDARSGNNNQSGGSGSAPYSSRNSQHHGGFSTNSSSSGYSNNYHHRRGAGFQGGGRNHPFGSDKGFSSSTARVKQIYVAKQRNQSSTS